MNCSRCSRRFRRDARRGAYPGASQGTEATAKAQSKVPTDLETICLKAIERDPDRRYQTARQLSEDLRRFVDRHAISARRIGLVGRAVRWAKRRPALAATATALFIVLIVASVLAFKNYLGQKEIARTRLTLIETNLKLGRESAMAGDFITAGEALDALKQLSAPPVELSLLEGLMLLNEGDAEGAEHCFLAAKAELPDDRLDVRLLLATSQFVQGCTMRCKLTSPK